MGIYTDLSAALNTRLQAIPITINIAWENTKYEPVEGVPYLRPTLLPAQTELSTLLGGQAHQGIYQVDVIAPLEKGISFITSTLDTLETLFSASRIIRLNSTAIYIKQIGREQAVTQDAWYYCPLSIHYLCYT